MNNRSEVNPVVLPLIETFLSSMTYESKPEWDAKDWQLLEALQHDARIGYAELGRKVRLSAPAVAERIKRLETDLGHRLFDRNTRRVQLTKQGLQLLPHARKLLIDARRCQTLFSDAKAPVTLTLGTRFELGLSWVVPQLGVRSTDCTSAFAVGSWFVPLTRPEGGVCPARRYRASATAAWASR